jgi:hypothetical protein
LLDILKGIEDVTSKDFWFDLSVRWLSFIPV